MSLVWRFCGVLLEKVFLFVVFQVCTSLIWLLVLFLVSFLDFLSVHMCLTWVFCGFGPGFTYLVSFPSKKKNGSHFE